LFNIPVLFRSGAEPAPRDVVLIHNREDLSLLPIPDFQHSGLMPQALSCFRKMKEILGEQWDVGFPDWCRGPLGTAFYLRGFENTLVDLYQDPDFAKEVMELGLGARKSWMSARAELLGLQSPGGAVLWNDDVAKENFSPEVYENHIFPFDTEFHKFHEGKVGFHSCGNTTPFLKIIRNLSPLEFFHVSPWTDLEEAVSIFHPDTLLLVALNPVKDVLGAKPAELRDKLEYVRDVCSGGPYIVMATELMRFRTPEEDMIAIKRMLDIAVEVLCR